MKKALSPIMLLIGIAAFAPAATATTLPFEESFTSDNSGWTDVASTPLTWESSGGTDGSYASGTFNFVDTDETGPTDPGQVIFRGGPTASGSAFVGNWLSDGVTGFSAYIRHDAAESLFVFTRFASPANFPGAVGVDVATPVPPDTWTQINIPIVDSFPLPPFVTYEGSDFATVFSSIGNLQIGVNVPAGVANVDADITFDLDRISIVPEPASMLFVAFGGIWICACRPRRGTD